VKQDAFFIDITVKAPVIQIISLILGLVILASEYPAPFMKGTAVYRSLVARVVLFTFQVFFAVLFYRGDEWGNLVSCCRHLWLHTRK